MSHLKLPYIRRRYQYACGYCGVNETSAGGELTIDHYRPRATGGGDEDDNLVYACIKCNQYKADFWPDELDIAAERWVLHPLLDDWIIHFSENEQDGRLEAITPTGRFHIALLRLNRPALVAHRLEQRILSVLAEKVHLLEQQNEDLSQTIEAQKQYIRALERRLKELKRN
jgi:hypothetical protein